MISKGNINTDVLGYAYLANADRLLRTYSKILRRTVII